MPLTRLEPKTALVVIDVQKGTTGLPLTHPGSLIVERSARLARAFREAGQTVVRVTAAGRAPGRTDAGSVLGRTLPPGFADLDPALGAEPGDVLITKHRIGAFIGTTLHEELRARGVTQVAITGIATSGGVEASARSAHDHGYHVVLVTDAMTDRVAATHDFMITTIFPRLAETTTTTEELLASLGA